MRPSYINFRDMTMGQTTDGRRTDRRQQRMRIWPLRRASYKK